MPTKFNKYLTEYELVVEEKWTDLVAMRHLSEHENQTIIEYFYVESSLPKPLI
jgi:hypothetical protein